MSWDSDFYTALNTNDGFIDLVNDFYFEYKSDAVAPFAKYELISAVGTDDLDGASQEGYRLIQLTVWSSSPTESKNIAEAAISAAKQGLNVSQVFQRSQGRDPDEELFGYAVDFTVWFDNP